MGFLCHYTRSKASSMMMLFPRITYKEKLAVRGEMKHIVTHSTEGSLSLCLFLPKSCTAHAAPRTEANHGTVGAHGSSQPARKGSCRRVVIEKVDEKLDTRQQRVLVTSQPTASRAAAAEGWQQAGRGLSPSDLSSCIQACGPQHRRDVGL